jgi:hypothetical protein
MLEYIHIYHQHKNDSAPCDKKYSEIYFEGYILFRKQNKISTCIMLPETQVQIKQNLSQHPRGHIPTPAK